MEDFNFTEELKHLNLLYVEDDQAILDSLQRPLIRRVKQLYTAQNGQEGLEACLAYRPDIIVSDIRMPLLNGLEMGREIRKTYPNLPIIITSAFDDTKYFIEAIDIGVSQYVLKPVDLKKLLRALETCVRELALERRIQEKTAELRKHLKMLTEYKQAVEQGAVVAKSDPCRVITEVNDAFCRITGYTRAELVGQSYELIRAPQESADLCRAADKSVQERRPYKNILQNRRKNGEVFYTKLTIVPILDERNQVEEFLDFHEDITQLINQIYTDPLTGYPNRSALSRDLAKIPAPLLLVLNIDAFKEINDFYGNEAGDYLLKEMTLALDTYAQSLPGAARLYKLSSDEYAILFGAPGDCGNPWQLIETLQERIEHDVFQYEGNEINLGLSIGFSTASRDTLTRADMALRQAKKKHLAAVCFEEVGDIKKIFEHNILWSKKLKKAIEEKRIQPWFQPIISNHNGKVVKYECLVRMQDEDGKIISPEHFLGIAYKSRLYHKLSHIMMEKSCAFFRDQPYSFSINMTASEILYAENIEFLKRIAVEYGVADRLIIELLESEGIEKYPEVARFIHDMKNLGCQVAIDDFGTGYSNFEHLLRLKADFIKIDGSIIQHIHNDQNSFIIAQTIAEFARRLGVQTIAEYVHSAEVQEKVRAIGIDFSQGYYHGQPAPDVLLTAKRG